MVDSDPKAVCWPPLRCSRLLPGLGAAALWVADEAVQVFGGYGYMRDYPVEKLMRDAKVTEIFDGTSEILRLVIARELLHDHLSTKDCRAP